MLVKPPLIITQLALPTNLYGFKPTDVVFHIAFRGEPLTKYLLFINGSTPEKYNLELTGSVRMDGNVDLTVLDLDSTGVGVAYVLCKGEVPTPAQLKNYLTVLIHKEEKVEYERRN